VPEKPFAAYQGVEPFLFASYAHADDAVVFPELLRLHEAGYRVWYDEGIDPAEEWPQSISQALLTSQLVVVFLSPRALASKWVRREIGLAVRREKQLLPVYLEPLALPDDLEFQIGHVQAINRYEWSSEAFFQQMARRLDKVPDLCRRQRADRTEWVLRSLADAAAAQKGMLGPVPAAVPGYSFWAAMETATAGPGGDLYDFHTLPTGEILVLLGDISGHGIAAVVKMVALLGMVTTVVEMFGADLVGAMQAVNRAYCRRMGSLGAFATLLAAVLDPARHLVRAVNAGHGPALIRRRGGEVHDLVPRNQTGLPLGLDDLAGYEETTVELGVGDAVFVASDGVSDAGNVQNELYGLPRLQAVLAGSRGGASDVGGAVLADLQAFVGVREHFDDLTAVCLVRDS
jgi:serine phosphatase RsbU (regulator of sigma subunit)